MHPLQPRYVTGLTTLLAGMKSEQGKAMIHKVQNVIILCIVVVFFTITGIVIYAMFVDLCKDNGPTATLIYMIFLFCVHFGELVGMGALLYQCSSTRKTQSGGYADKEMRSTAASTAVAHQEKM